MPDVFAHPGIYSAENKQVLLKLNRDLQDQSRYYWLNKIYVNGKKENYRKIRNMLTLFEKSNFLESPDYDDTIKFLKNLKEKPVC
jgi:hypothetical protein